MKMVTQWLEDALNDVQLEKVGIKLVMLVMIVLGLGALSLYILLNSPA